MTDPKICNDHYMVSQKSRRVRARKLFKGGALVLLAGLTLYCFSSSDGGAQDGDPAMAPVLKLAAVKLLLQNVSTQEEIPGRTTAYQIAEIRPQVSGILADRLFEEGSSVEAGKQLYQIDPAVYQADYNSAAADLQSAEANLASIQSRQSRYESLVKINAVSQQDFDDIQSGLAQSKAQVAVAEAAMARMKINLDYTKVLAPISGRISKSWVTKGALVTANQPQILATITQLDPIFVDLTQSSKDLMRLRREFGALDKIPVTLQINEGEAPYEHSGQLLFHEVEVDRTTGSVQLRAQFPNPDQLLLPGLYVRANLELHYPNSLLIPLKATQRLPDQSLAVWRLGADGVVKQAKIQVKRAVGSEWLVESGVSAGDVIVTEGLIKLQEGSRVEPVFAETTSN